MAIFDTAGGIFQDLNESFGGYPSSVQQSSLISPEQERALKEVNDYVLNYIGEFGRQYPGQLVAEMPASFYGAFQDFERNQYGAISQRAIEDLISGEPAYVFEPGKATARWEETFASPVMQSYRENVLPMILEQQNAPGVLYSRGRSDRVTGELQDFFGSRVAPTLFTSLQAGEQRGFESAEAAASRRSTALGLPGALTMQEMSLAQTVQAARQLPLTAERAEWLRRLPEPGWAVNTALGYMTQPTVENIGFQGYNPAGDIAQMALAGAMMP